MGHLEMIRAKSELRRSRKMVHGLGNFIKGTTTSKKGRRKDSHRPTADATFRRCRARSGELRMGRESSISEMPSPAHENKSEDIAVVFESISPCPEQHQLKARSKRGVSFNAAHDTKRSMSVDYTAQATILQEESVSADVRETFERAADSVRESVELDGAIFLDASIGSFGGLVKDSNSRRGSTMSQNYFTGPGQVESTEHKACVVLGSSVKDQNSSAEQDEQESLPCIREAFLQELLCRHPRGKIWTYDDDEETRNDIDSDFDSSDSTIYTRTEQLEEKIILQGLFPGVRSLAFVGMWDSHRARWFAASIVWTRSPTRIFSTDLELRYLVAFGQSVMAEIARLDAWTADRAKATFISSISHELRTPLHGIMGSSECLQGTDMDAFQSGLLSTIETCGKTLLDTFDNLLSFAKINNLMTSSSTQSVSSAPSIEKSGIGMAFEEVDISLLTEEVVETVFAGHEFRRIVTNGRDVKVGSDSSALTLNLRQPLNRDGTRDFDPIRVVLDYDELTTSNWNFKTQPGGWRRIVMNLVGNSLKYTDAGSVTVKLEATSIPDATNQMQVTLTVRDTGRGMSREFLQSQLFSPFVQEDPLTPGTGLGLSIVKQLVTGMGGTIDVKSEKDQGTETRVSIVMTRSSAEEVDISNQSLISSIKRRCQDLHLNVLDTADFKSRRQVTSTANIGMPLEAICGNWFGMNVTSSAEPQVADVYVVTERHLHTLTDPSVPLPQKNLLAKKPLIILCKDSSSVRNQNLAASNAFLDCHVVPISQPYGPIKVGKAIASCLDHIRNCGQRPLLHPSRSDSRPSLSRRFDSAQYRTQLHRTDRTVQTSSPSVALKNFNLDPLAIIESKVERVSISDLPINRSTPKDSTADGSVTSPLNSTPEIRKPDVFVLLVDDNRINLQLLSTFVKKQQHYKFETAMDGLQAFEAYQAGLLRAVPSASLPDDSTPQPRAYDFVLMDVNMPIMDGLESTRCIRAFEQTHNLQPATIIALTGMASASARQEAFASGIDLFLTKPVRLKELTSILEKRELQL